MLSVHRPVENFRSRQESGWRRAVRAMALPIACLAAGIATGHARAAAAAAADPNLSHPTAVDPGEARRVHAGRAGHAPAGRGEVPDGIVLFPGYPGIMRLTGENGDIRFELRGNFLVRSRRYWLDEETLVVVVDAPSTSGRPSPSRSARHRATGRTSPRCWRRWRSGIRSSAGPSSGRARAR